MASEVIGKFKGVLGKCYEVKWASHSKDVHVGYTGLTWFGYTSLDVDLKKKTEGWTYIWQLHKSNFTTALTSSHTTLPFNE